MSFVWFLGPQFVREHYLQHKVEIKKLLEEKERWGSEDKGDGLRNQKSIVETTYLCEDALDGLLNDTQNIIYGGINMGELLTPQDFCTVPVWGHKNIFCSTTTVISVIKDKENALHNAAVESEKKLADKDVSICQCGSVWLLFPYH